jgi:hypothetical protein
MASSIESANDVELSPHLAPRLIGAGCDERLRLGDLAQLGETAIAPFVEQFWRSV